MGFKFRKATYEPAPLLIGVCGPSSSGKTYSMLRLARGIAGPQGKVAMGDTENRRGLHYVNDFDFDYTEFEPPFSPERCTEFIEDVNKEGYPVAILDSTSHEWAGKGGCSDMQETILTRMAGDDWQKREKCNALAWSKPKQAHQDFMDAVIRSKTHLIFGLRALDKLKVVKGANGKVEFVPGGWTPICEKHFMFEMTVSLMLDPTKPGIPTPIKIEGQHKLAFPAGELISEDSGKRLLAWQQAGQTGGDAGVKGAKFILRDARGGELKQYERMGAFIEALGGLVDQAEDATHAAALWDTNMDAFYIIQNRAQKQSHKETLDACRKVMLAVNVKTSRPEDFADDEVGGEQERD